MCRDTVNHAQYELKLTSASINYEICVIKSWIFNLNKWDFVYLITSQWHGQESLGCTVYVVKHVFPKNKNKHAI